MERQPLTLRLAGFVIAALSIAGCSTGTSQRSAVRRDANQSVLAQFVTSPNAERAALLIREHHRGDCMRARGWGYIDRAADELISSPEFSPDYSAAKFAATYGYGLTTNPPLDHPTRSPSDAYEGSLSKTQTIAFLTDLQGSPKPDDGRTYPDSCNAIVAKQLEPLTTAIDNVTNDYQTEVAEPLAAQATVVAASQDWVACMAKAGIRGYASHDEIYEHFGAANPSTWPSLKAEEVSDAVADRACSVSLDAVTLRSRLTLEEPYYERHLEQFATIQQLLRTYMR